MSLSSQQAAGSMRPDAKLTASDGATSDNFGYSVAISGDTVVVEHPSAPFRARRMCLSSREAAGPLRPRQPS